MTVIHKIVFVKKLPLLLIGLFCFSAVIFAENVDINGNQPSGLLADTTVVQQGNDFYVESNVEETQLPELSVLPIKDEKDSTEVEPKLEPLVLSGSGAVAAGVGVGVAAIFGAPILFVVAALLLGLGAFLTAKGWKKIKTDPKKFKGEKIAIANYLIIGLVGIAASFYLLYWLFMI